MRLKITMPAGLKVHYNHELKRYRQEMAAMHLKEAWYHLERSHILGQAYPIEHSYSHWLMLMFGIHIKSVKEILGQIPRLLVGGVKSFVGVIPLGNTGGANVPPLRPMPIPSELLSILKKYNNHVQ